MIEVYLPGTGGMKPLPGRFLTGLWTEHNGRALLIDCGESMQTALACCKRSLARLDTILFTHFHADHIAGLPGLLLSAGNAGKTSDMDIYAPKGAAAVISNICCICGEIPYTVYIHEIAGTGSFRAGGLEVRYMPVRHRIECYCYSILEHRKPVFSPEKADSLGVPPELRKKLHSGKSVEVNKRIITPEMVISGKRAPLKVTYMTDTVYFEELSDFAAGSDLLVCEGMYGSDEYIPKMRERGHMVFSQSARIAADSHSKELWLTHYSPALPDPSEYGQDVKRIFPAAVISTDGIHRTVK